MISCRPPGAVERLTAWHQSRRVRSRRCAWLLERPRHAAGHTEPARQPAPGAAPDAAPGDATGLRGVWSIATALERRQLLVLTGASAVLNLGFGAIVPVLPSLAQELHLGGGGLGLLFAVPSLARVLVNLPAGAVVDRHGRVPGMVAGQLSAALGCFGTGLGGSLLVILPARFLGGGGGALAAAGSSAYLADLTARPHLLPFRGTIVGASSGLISAAYVVGPAVGGGLTALWGYQGAYCAVAALTLACSGAYATLPETLAAPAPTAAERPPRLLVALRESYDLLRDPSRRALFAGTAAQFLNYSAMVTVLPLHMAQAFGLSAGEIGLVFSVGATVGVGLSPAAGQFADRYGRTVLVGPAALLCAGGCVGVGYLGGFYECCAAFLLWSVGEAVLATALSTYAVDVAPRGREGAAMALPRQAGDLTFLLAPLALGCLYDAAGSGAPMAATALLTVVGGALFGRGAREVAKLR